MGKQARCVVSIGLRVSESSKRALDLWVETVGAELGTRVSQTQAVEIAVREALSKRGVLPGPPGPDV